MEGDWRKIKPTVGQAWSHLLETGLYTDVSFKVGPTKHAFDAHKVVIMARSEVFAVMLQDRWDEVIKTGERTTIDIPHATYEAFEQFIKYLYTDVFVDVTPISEILEVLHLAHMYQVPGLISKCSTLLNLNINLDNCVQIYQGTRLYRDEEINLSDASFDFFTKHVNQIVDTPEFLHLDKEGLTELMDSDNLVIDEIALFKAVLRWSSQEESSEEIKQGRKDVLKSVIPLIRFPLMGMEAFAKEVVPTKLLTEAETIEMFLFFAGETVEPSRFKAKPRVGTKCNSKRRQIECFESESSRYQKLHNPIGYMGSIFDKKVVRGLPQIRFTSDKDITIHEIGLFGLVSDSIKCLLHTHGLSGSTMHFLVKIDISNSQKNISSTCSKITTSELDQIVISLEQPLNCQAHQFYSIAASLDIEHTQFQPNSSPKVEYRCGVLNNMIRKCSDGITFSFSGISGDRLTIIHSLTVSLVK